MPGRSASDPATPTPPASLPERLRTIVAARPGLLIALALGVVYLIWGSTYLAITVVVAELPPMLTMSARFLVAGGLLLAFAHRRGDRAGDRIRPRQLVNALITGGLVMVGGMGAFALAQTRISSGLAALIAATVPMFLALFARGAFGERLSLRAWLGLAVGLVGVGVLVDPTGGQLPAILLCLGGSAAWAAGSLRSRVADAPRRPMVAASLEMLGASLIFALIGLARGEVVGIDLFAVSGRAWFGVLYLTVAGSLVAYTAYSWLLRNVSTTIVGTYAYVNPIIAVGLGWLVLGERVTSRTGVAGALVLVSVILLVTGRPGEPVPAQPTSGADVFAGSRRWHRIKRGVGSLPRAARLYRDPGVAPYRSTGYDPLDAVEVDEWVAPEPEITWDPYGPEEGAEVAGPRS